MSAAEIADSINWNKIKNVNTLVKIGEIYEKAERYQDARDILLMAYDRSPIGRMIIYRLAEVAIKMGDYDAATEYYDEFVEIAPHDDMKYVLRYAIKKGQGASFDELITILEEYKDEEYTEEWAYELDYGFWSFRRQSFQNLNGEPMESNPIVMGIYGVTTITGVASEMKRALIAKGIL